MYEPYRVTPCIVMCVCRLWNQLKASTQHCKQSRSPISSTNQSGFWMSRLTFLHHRLNIFAQSELPSPVAPIFTKFFPRTQIEHYVLVREPMCMQNSIYPCVYIYIWNAPVYTRNSIRVCALIICLITSVYLHVYAHTYVCGMVNGRPPLTL